MGLILKIYSCEGQNTKVIRYNIQLSGFDIDSDSFFSLVSNHDLKFYKIHHLWLFLHKNVPLLLRYYEVFTISMSPDSSSSGGGDNSW